jgi:hypothetical protein
VLRAHYFQEREEEAQERKWGRPLHGLTVQGSASSSSEADQASRATASEEEGKEEEEERAASHW